MTPAGEELRRHARQLLRRARLAKDAQALDGRVFDTAYIPDRKQRRHRLASPAWGANSDSIVGIAPAVVVTAEHDRLRNEAHRYAEKLHAAGSLVDYHEVTGVDHGYNIMSTAHQVTEQMYALIAGYVTRATRSP
ncbi:hypothetical protein MLIT_42350 [Mycolicibacterium litorale]|uniref:Alpha/beta hydrolase fold-3 domain-containing protein n=1 Tax=Mycolicibacterium litorale TaxID=758802 RepID=A0AAD1MWC2_9MYCO|nr:hypothetical protein MLIT_42350 [Mycolicibacterium litorale]